MDEDRFLEMVEGATLTVLARIGDDTEARFRFFRRLLVIAQEEALGRRSS
jgi:hypothetical protein